MTTPERLRRRQLIEGSALILLAIFTLLQAIYFNQQDASQRDCLASVVHDMAESQGIRADLNQRDSENKTRVIRDVAQAKDEADLREAFRRFDEEQSRIDALGIEHPVPAFPDGRCE